MLFDQPLSNSHELDAELHAFVASVNAAHIPESFDPSAAPDPRSQREAYARPDGSYWRVAVTNEVENLYTTKTIVVVPRPVDHPVGRGMFVFKRKTLGDGSLDKYKARFVIRGNTQVKGIDFTDTFAPTLRVASLRYVAQLAIDHGWSTRCGDVPGAYLNPDQPNRVYIEQIPGFVSQPPGTEPIADHTVRRQMYVLQVLTGLYGSVNSGYLWAVHRDTTFRSLGLTQCTHDPCVWYRGKVGDADFVLLAVYVDDIALTGPESPSRTAVWDGIVAKYRLEDKGELRWFLALGFEWHADYVTMNQSKYAADLLERFNMMGANPARLPLPSNFNVSGHFTLEGDGIDAANYRPIVGCLLYLCNTRPDLQFAIGYLSRFMASPSPLHLRLAKHVLRYVRGTVHLGITYRRTPESQRYNLFAWSDSDFAGDTSMRSTSGFVLYTNPASAPIFWYSRRQTTVATSTCNAEILAMHVCARELLAFRGLMHELGALSPGPSVMYGDNEGAIALTAEYAAARGSRHFTTQVAWLREQLVGGIMRFEHTDTELMRADSLTKLLTFVLMDTHRKWLLGMDLESAAAMVMCDITMPITRLLDSEQNAPPSHA